ncbi:hypothetical protein ANN_13258 [Periplaneta americana]|uniref:Uncharacterized protein n=1 Tax=Periplaneta americana TaxID=6978 RepID=A0ABQ8TIW8_PERAM|nr:hypothetical protein ANN_13258 [Periplaneta americana]
MPCPSQTSGFNVPNYVSPSPNPQAGGPPLIGCPRLLIQYIRSYPPYLEAVSSIRNLRKRHAMVIGTHNTWISQLCTLNYVKGYYSSHTSGESYKQFLSLSLRFLRIYLSLSPEEEWEKELEAELQDYEVVADGNTNQDSNWESQIQEMLDAEETDLK